MRLTFSLGIICFFPVLSGCQAVKEVAKHPSGAAIIGGTVVAMVNKGAEAVTKCPQNFVCTDSNKEPAPGYVKVNDSQAVWKPGLTHPTNEHIVSADQENYWKPEIGYNWSSGSRDFQPRRNAENLKVIASRINLDFPNTLSTRTTSKTSSLPLNRSNILIPSSRTTPRASTYERNKSTWCQKGYYTGDLKKLSCPNLTFLTTPSNSKLKFNVNDSSIPSTPTTSKSSSSSLNGSDISTPLPRTIKFNINNSSTSSNPTIKFNINNSSTSSTPTTSKTSIFPLTRSNSSIPSPRTTPYIHSDFINKYQQQDNLSNN